MVALLKDFPKIKATYNLVPSLLVQLEGYLHGEKDTFQELFNRETGSLSPEEASALVRHFFSANTRNLIKPYPRYKFLFEKKELYAGTITSPADWLRIFSSAEMRDLQVWYSLSHFDEEYKKNDGPIKELIKKGEHFTEADKQVVRDKEMELMGKIVPCYRQFAESGQIEISTTPFYHPILPLLLEPQLGRETNPTIPPYDLNFSWPQDALSQLESALTYMKKTFGKTPAGVWPSEGSLSREVVDIMENLGVLWTATDEENLSKSLGVPILRDNHFIVQNPEVLYKPYVLSPGKNGRESNIRIFFRDRHLSDLIGFHYRKMSASRAAADLVERLKEIPAVSGQELVIPIILDGENAWEYYRNSGREFLCEFFQRVSEDDQLETVTFSDVLHIKPGIIPHYKAGSWINGNFDIWIGDEEDRKAWRLLEKTRLAIESRKDALTPEQLLDVRHYLAIAQGSDWFWWFGKENYTPDLDIFDNLFRKNLQKVFEILHLEVPVELYTAVSSAATVRAGNIKIVLPLAPLAPQIDGRVSSYFEWLNAGRLETSAAGGAMTSAHAFTHTLYYGFDDHYFFLRIDTEKDASFYLEKQYSLDVIFRKEKKHFRFPVIAPAVAGQEARVDMNVAVGSIIELAISLTAMNLKAGELFFVQLEWKRDGLHIQSVPSHDFFQLAVPTSKDYAASWQV